MLALNGGTLELSGGSHTETVGSTTLGAGASYVTRTSGTSVLRMGTLDPNAGSTINFSGDNIAQSDRDNENGILGAFATVGAVGSANWATETGSGNNNPIVGLTSYRDFSNLPEGGSSGNNYILNGGATLSVDQTINSLKINTTGAGQSLELGSSHFTIGTGAVEGGGILFVGSNNYTINGGTLQTNSTSVRTHDFIIQQWGTGTLTINSVIRDGSNTTALTKAGPGTAILGAANIYTGGTYVTAGTLLVNNTTGSGTGTGAVLATGSGTVLGGSGTVSGNVTVNGFARIQGGNGTTGTSLKISGSLTLADNSIVQLALGPTGTHSTLARTGTGSWVFDSDQAFNFTNVQAGSYDNIITGLASDPGSEAMWTILNAGYTGTFTWDGMGNIDLTLTAVPEAATWFGGALAVLLLAWSGAKRSRNWKVEIRKRSASR